MVSIEMSSITIMGLFPMNVSPSPINTIQASHSSNAGYPPRHNIAKTTFILYAVKRDFSDIEIEHQLIDPNAKTNVGVRFNTEIFLANSKLSCHRQRMAAADGSLITIAFTISRRIKLMSIRKMRRVQTVCYSFVYSQSLPVALQTKTTVTRRQIATVAVMEYRLHKIAYNAITPA